MPIAEEWTAEKWASHLADLQTAVVLPAGYDLKSANVNHVILK